MVAEMVAKNSQSPDNAWLNQLEEAVVAKQWLEGLEKNQLTQKGSSAIL